MSIWNDRGLTPAGANTGPYRLQIRQSGNGSRTA